MTSTISCFTATAIVPSRPPRASEPVSPMKICAGGALNHRKPHAGADQRAADDRELAGLDHEIDAEIFREDRVADEIGDEAERAGRDHHRHDREPIEAVGEVDRVAGGDDDEGAEDREQPAQIGDVAVDAGDREAAGMDGAAGVHDRAGDERDGEFSIASRERPEKPACVWRVTFR